IIKGGLYLEALSTVDTVLLDKTGTLTFGTPQIQEVVSANGFGERQIIGAGGVSDVYVARAGQVLGSIRIADVLRPEAKNAVAAMRQMGLRTVLLSGDTQAATSSVGRDLGVDEAVGGLLPEQKAKWVTELRSKGRNV